MDINPVLVEVLRGDAVESSHRGAWAVVDADGTLHSSDGDIERPIFPRSAIKVLQALPLVESGAADVFRLGDDELALACASHGGEPDHVQTAAQMLSRAGQDVSVLESGAHWPYDDAALKALARTGQPPSALHNNCSGKHAGFVCLGCHLAREAGQGDDPRAFLRGYVDAAHPVMREVAAAIEAATGHDLSSTPVGIDGCSIPAYAIPLRRLAHAFARIGTGTGLREGHARAARRLREAVANAPFMAAGSGRFDTLVMQRLGERVFCKVGAEGVHCAAVPELGLGLAVKVDDGNNARGCEVVMAALLQRLLGAALDDDEAAALHKLSHPTLTNWNGIEVGALRPAPALDAR